MGDPVTTVASQPMQGAGSVVQFSFDAGSSYVQVPYIESIPQLGTEGQFIDVTPIDELVRQYIPGIKDGPDWTLVWRDVGSSVGQDQLIAASEGTGSTVLGRVTYSSGRVADFSMALNGHYAAEVSLDSVLMHAVQGKITGEIAWSKVA